MAVNHHGCMVEPTVDPMDSMHLGAFYILWQWCVLVVPYNQCHIHDVIIPRIPLASRPLFVIVSNFRSIVIVIMIIIIVIINVNSSHGFDIWCADSNSVLMAGVVCSWPIQLPYSTPCTSFYPLAALRLGRVYLEIRLGLCVGCRKCILAVCSRYCRSICISHFVIQFGWVCCGRLRVHSIYPPRPPGIGGSDHHHQKQPE